MALTGASGFIGQHLARELLGTGHRVRVLSRRPLPDLEQEGAEVVIGSLFDSPQLEELVRDAEVVVHAAGATQAASDAEFDEVNARATARLAATSARSGVEHFVLVSSLAARSPHLSGYARSKRDAETAVAAESGIRWTVVRPPAVYGPGDKATLEIFRLMRRGFLPVPSDPAARASLIYVADLCGAIGAVLAEPGANREILEVRDDCPDGYSWREIAEVAGQCFGKRIVCIPVPHFLMWLAGNIGVVKCQLTGKPARFSPGKVRELCHIDWVCRGNPIEDQTDWMPRVGIEEGFRRTIGWYREHNWL